MDEAVQVYRLMGLAAMNKGDLEQAQQAIRELLQIVPSYEADPIQDTPSYTTLVAIVRQEVATEALPEEQQAPSEEQQTPSDPPQVSAEQPRPRTEEPEVIPIIPQNQASRQRRSARGPKTWLLASGGAIVVITVVALALGGGSSSSPSG